MHSQICDSGSLVPDNVAQLLGETAARALEGSKRKGPAPALNPERLKELQAQLKVGVREREVFHAVLHTVYYAARVCIEENPAFTKQRLEKDMHFRGMMHGLQKFKFNALHTGCNGG